MRVAVVLAGGLGTRVAAVTGPAQPKALLPVAGRPFVEWKLRQLAALGVTDAILLTGHGGDALRDHVGDGSRFGLRAACHDDGPRLLGTGGAVRAVLDRVPERFWLTYGDSLVEAPLEAVEGAMPADALATMTVLRNEDRWEPSNVEVTDARVTRYGKGAPPGTFAYIDYGLLLFRRDAFAAFDDEPFDLAAVVERLVAQRRLAAFEVAERFHDIGTVTAWRETDAWATETDLATRLAGGAGGERR
jgi:NDP-sugar pyrophosphorylase family protein